MSLRSAMAAFAAENPKLSNYSLARKFLLAVTQKTLIAMLANEFQHIRRGAVRSVEASVAASATAPLKTLKQQKEALEQIRPLLDKRYPTLSGGGTGVEVHEPSGAPCANRYAQRARGRREARA